jgi:hypothetical protein
LGANAPFGLGKLSDALAKNLLLRQLFIHIITKWLVALPLSRKYHCAFSLWLLHRSQFSL